MSVFRSGASALITGGASGIGLAVAELCLSHGMRVSIVDFDAQALDHARTSLAGDVQFVQADVGQEADWTAVRQRVGDVDFLMLNAGVGGTGTWGEGEYFQKILSTNLFGVINGLNAYVPSFKARPSGSPPSAIVITGSKQGITNPPGNPAYNASKAAVKSLAEHLSWDLREKQDVGVHLLVPGWTFTGLSGNKPGSSASKPAGAWTAAQVANHMYTAMASSTFYIICPDNDVSAALDKQRMLWAAGDAVEGRPPLSRWREEWKESAERWIKGEAEEQKA